MVYSYFSHSVILNQFASMVVQKTAEEHVFSFCGRGGMFFRFKRRSKPGFSLVNLSI
jgi:hypothetical protein